MSEPVYTAVVGDNSDLIREVARLYLMPGMRIADVTYGKGVFWRQVDLTQYSFYPSDLKDGVDFRRLPYDDGTLDVVVLDPPYMHDPGHPQTDYNHVTNRGRSHDDIVQLYVEGMTEARRVLRVGGQLWVKCMDEISSGRQCWGHIELYERAQEIEFEVQDLFILLRKTATLQVKRQLHARKNHSYLWVFEKGL